MSNKLVIIMILFNISLCSSISYYVERESMIGGKDYVHIFLGENNNQKIVYSLETQFRNKEVFRLKICKEGTIQEVRAAGEDDVQVDEIISNNCIIDQYNNRSIIDYDQKMLLEEFGIYNVYKICVFGFVFPETEKSFLLAGFKDLVFKDLIEESKTPDNSNLYFWDSAMVGETVKGEKDNNYRNDFDSKAENRCKLNFSQHELSESKFLPNSFLKSGENVFSYLIVEYNFDDFQKDTGVQHDEMKTEEITADNQIKMKEKVFKSLENGYLIKQKIEVNTEIKFQLQNRKNHEGDITMDDFNQVDKNAENDGVKLKIQIGTDEFIGFYPIPLEKNTFIRFYPLVCFQRLEAKPDIDYSFEFIGDHNCIPLSNEKIIMIEDEHGDYFVKKVNNANTRSNEVHFNYDALLIDLIPKDDPSSSVKINGFVQSCDSVFDREGAVFFLVCYQNFVTKTRFINKRVLPGSLVNNKYFELSQNSKKKTKANRRTQDKAKKYLFIASCVLLVLSFIVFIAVGSSFFGWIFLILAVVSFVFFTLISSNRTANLGFFTNHKEFYEIKKNILKKSFHTRKVFSENPSQNMIQVQVTNNSLSTIEEMDKNILVYFSSMIKMNEEKDENTSKIVI
jgi:hypothetical protein